MVKIICPIVKCIHNKEIEFKHYCNADEIVLKRRRFEYSDVYCLRCHF